MKRLLMIITAFAILLTGVSITAVNAAAVSEYYYVYNDFEDEKELSDWSVDLGAFGLAIEDNKLTVKRITSGGSDFPKLMREVNIPSDKNFLIDYKIDSIGKWCSFKVFLNGNEIGMIKGAQTGEFEVYVDRKNKKAVIYQGKNVIFESSNLPSGDINRIDFSPQSYNGSSTTIDYIYVYELPSSPTILNGEAAEPSYIDFSSAPVTDDDNLQACLSVDSETAGENIERTEKLRNGLYRVYFTQSFDAESEHTLYVRNLQCRFNEEPVDCEITFKIRSKKREIRLSLDNNDFSECGEAAFNITKNIKIEITNEIDEAPSQLTVIAAGYNTKMTFLKTYELPYSTDTKNMSIELNEENFCGNMSVELYAVDNLSSMKRISKKEKYTITKTDNGYGTAELQEEEYSENLSSKSCIVEYSKDPDKAVLTFTVTNTAVSEEECGEVTLVLSKGYDEQNEPEYAADNFYYIKTSNLENGKVQFCIEMPDENKMYTAYCFFGNTEPIKKENIFFCSAEFTQKGLEMLQSAKSESEFAEAVTQYGAIFGISEYAQNKEIIKTAMSLRDEQGGLKNAGDVSGCFERAGILVTKHDGDAGALLDYINGYSPFNADVWTAYNKKIAPAGAVAVRNAILTKNYETVKQLQETFNEAVVLCGIEKAEHYTQTGYIIEKLGKVVAGISENDYKNSDTAAVFTKLTGMHIENLADLKSTLAALVKANPKKQQTTGGGTQGGSTSYRGSSSGTTAKSEFNADYVNSVKEEEQKKTAETVFEDIEGVPWAKDAIVNLYAKGIISGRKSGEFAPNDNITRGEIAKMICIGLNLDMSGECPAGDVAEKAWYRAFVTGVMKYGIMNGTDSNSFSAEENITREMLAAILFRMTENKGCALKTFESDFNDAAFAEDYAKPAIGALQKAGMINGDSGNFNPKSFCTRAECAKMFYGIITYIENQDL